MGLISDIIKYIVGTGDKRLFVTENRDGFILKHKSAFEQEYGASCRVFSGSSLDLRIVHDYEMLQDANSKFIFVPTEDFNILEDIAEDCELVTINAQRFLSRYHWHTIKDLNLPELEWLYSQKQIMPLNAIETDRVVKDYHNSPDFQKQAVQEIIHDWDRITSKVDFRKSSEFMPALSQLMVHALKLESFDKLDVKIRELNEKFQQFLYQHYLSIVSSGASAIRPKIVSKIAPFIAKQDSSCKYAVIVIDGMNFWQAMILASAIEDTSRNISIKYEASFAWLPSVTELSRQAIFSGGAPSINYTQSPYAEQKIWEEFWTSKRVPIRNIYYQYNGELTPYVNSTRIGYVNTELDDMMHNARDYNYLHEDTLRWIKESSIVSDIIKLAAQGCKIYLTSDHGNIETVPFRSLSASDKAGARSDRRYITLSEHADAAKFEHTYEGHVEKVFDSDRTYYASDREIFSSQKGVITHGGTHFLEVIIPFFTIQSK